MQFILNESIYCRIELSLCLMSLSFYPGERGLTVLCTKPKILFCDLKLSPGSSRSCKMIEYVNFLQ